MDGMMRSRIGWLFLLILGAPLAASAADYVVIVNPRNATSSLSARDLSQIFLKKQTRWPDGQKVEVVMLADTAPASTAFDKEILRRSAAAVRAYWQQEIFSGRAVPPFEKGSDDEVVAFVTNNAGAIGYIATAPTKPGVKVVRIGE
jgi:ABC-type phosphate transport system substrate-binding protein